MTCGRLSSGIVNSTEIGCSWVITTMPVASEAWTMLPGSTRRRPTTPVIGAVTFAYVSCSLRVVDVGVVLLDGGFVLRDERDLRVQLLLRNGLGRSQHLVALDIHLRVVQQRLIVRQRRLRQLELHLIRPRVDLGQDLSLL